MRRTRYIWDRPAWPDFTWNAEALLVPLGSARRAQGEFGSLIAHLGFRGQERTELDARTDEAVQTADIEGEPLSRVAVRSSIARRLRIDDSAVAAPDAKIEGLVDMTLDATIGYAAPLTVERLHRWHIGLFPIVAGERPKIAIGQWRNDLQGPMQVVSGRIDKPIVHFEAPPAERLVNEMNAFLRWFEGDATEDGLLKSAVAHVWFLTIHPYDDGNGRMARAIADMALARDEQSPHRYLSMSRQINAEKRAYYDMLERTQQGGLDITEWLVWFLGCYVRAIQSARSTIDQVLHARRFWRSHEDTTISERQKRVLTRYLQGFEGKLTVKKWATLVKVSDDTALRDITDLVNKGVLVRNAGGSKNTSYALVYELST